MKKLNLAIFCIFLIILFFNTKVLAYSYEDKKKVVQEVMGAYYRKGTNMQYESIKRNYFIGPEEATEDNIVFSTCHTFAYQIYRQAFSIYIPKGCSETYEYCKIKKNSEYVPIFYVPDNFTNTTADYGKESADYKRLLQAFETGQKEKDEVYLNFINNLKVGDIITQSRRNSTLKKTAAHTMVVYKFTYNEQGEKTDCILMESTYSSDLGGGLIDQTGDKLEKYGTIRTKELSKRLEYYATYYTTYKPLCLVVLRPLGNSGDSFCSISMSELKAHNENNNTVIHESSKAIELNGSSKDRLNYEGIDISKTGSKHNNSVVALGDKITYTLKIANNSTEKYNGITVKEIIDPELVELVDNNIENTTNENGKIELVWNNIEIDSKKTKTIQYTVKVKKNKNNFNKKIISDGRLNNIKITTVTNIIGTVLSDEEKLKLNESINNIDYTNYTNGLKLVSDIYYNAFGVDIKLKKQNNTYIKVSEIIKTNDSYDIEFINNEMKKIALNDCFGTWEASYRVTDSSRYYVWGTATQEVGDQRAKTILKGNLNYGDIILVENNNENTAYIYLEDRIIGANEVINGVNNTSGKYNTEDEENRFLANLTSKDAFVILSPVLNHNMTQTELSVDYSTKNLTNKNVIVTITANEKIQDLEGWTLSDDEKKLTKEYNANAEEDIVVSDLAGNESTIKIKIDNIFNPSGDLNENNQIDIGDILILLRHMAQANNITIYEAHPEWKLSQQKILNGDLNKNDIIDIGDILKLKRYIAAQNSNEVAVTHPDWLNL